MNKRFSILAVLAIAALAVGLEVNAQTASQPNVGVAVTSPPPGQLFRANEFSVRMAALNPMDIGTQDTFDAKAASLAGFEAGLGYYVTRYLGAEVNIPVWRSDSRCFQSVSAGVIARLPLDAVWDFENHMVGKMFMDHIAPYVRAGLAYNECYTSPYGAYVGGGLEVRFNRTISAFGGVIYSQRGVFAPDSWGVIRPEVGLRLSF